ncbi:glycosyltransferase family 4 protein [Candidatus Berkelbacteria bacterium]|nr:glycosyltransferase family 4 protein [Candidatus Berkelbacteria bacterium]
MNRQRRAQSVLITKYARSIGGGEIYTLELFRGLHAAGQPVRLALNRDCPLIPQLTAAEKKRLVLLDDGPEPINRRTALLFLLKFPFLLLRQTVWLKRLHQTDPLRCLVLQNRQDQILLTILGRHFGIPVFWVEHQAPIHGSRRHPFEPWLIRLAKTTAGIIVPSRFLADRLSGRGWPASKIVVVAHGMNPPRRGQRTAIRHQLSIPSGAIVVGYVGRIDREKGIDLLIKSFQTLAARDTRLHLLLVGTGPDFGIYRDQIRQLRRRRRVTMTGYRAAYQPYFSALDIFVLPTRRDNFPLALLEAMHAGRAIITTPVGGIPEIITNQTGMIIPLDDPGALTNALETLIEDPDRRRRFQTAARTRAAHLFTRERMIRTTQAVLTSRGGAI